jgi:hypothetical protein
LAGTTLPRSTSASQQRLPTPSWRATTALVAQGLTGRGARMQRCEQTARRTFFSCRLRITWAAATLQTVGTLKTAAVSTLLLHSNDGARHACSQQYPLFPMLRMAVTPRPFLCPRCCLDSELSLRVSACRQSNGQILPTIDCTHTAITTTITSYCPAPRHRFFGRCR